MKIALIAHDKKKGEIIELAKEYKDVLANYELYATGTTGTLIMGETSLPIHRMKSGPLGGDQQIGALNAGLLQEAVAGTVAVDAHHVIKVGDGLYLLGVPVNDGDIVTLLAELLHQRAANLAAAYDKDPQTGFFIFFDSEHMIISIYCQKTKHLSIVHYTTFFKNYQYSRRLFTDYYFPSLLH